MSEPKAEPIPVAFIVERLRQAHENSQQRILGSDIFEEAADCLEALSEAVDTLGSRLDSLQNEHDSLKHDHERLFARDTANLNRLIECQGRLDALTSAAERDISNAKHVCGTDGEGCEAYRAYYSAAARRHQKCGHCPIGALSEIRAVLAAPSAPSEVVPHAPNCLCERCSDNGDLRRRDDSAPSEGEKPSLRCGAIANDLVGQCIFADGHSGEHRYGS